MQHLNLFSVLLFRIKPHFSNLSRIGGLIMLVLLVSFTAPVQLTAQGHQDHDSHAGFISCELMAKYENTNTRVANKYLTHDKKTNRMMRSSAVAAQTATINVVFGPGAQANPDAMAAFQFAIDIWASTVVSDVPINIAADFANLGPGVLASAGPNFVFRNFTNAPVADVWYPSALAESIAGADLVGDPTAADLTVNLGNGFNWYFGTDMNPGAGQFDFVTVALHEIGHGMGFIGASSFNAGTGEGSVRFSTPPNIFIYTDFVELGDGTPIKDLPDPSVELGDALTSGDLFVTGANTLAGNGGAPAAIFAPSGYQGGSSYSHWDEATFPAGDPNSLMTPQLGQTESIHDVGDGTRGFFKDHGWGINDAELSPILANPTSLQQELPVDESASQILNLSNISEESVDFELSIDPAVGWLTLDPTSGSLATTENTDITVDFDATGLSKGFFNTEIVLTPTGFPDGEIRVAVALRVLDGTEAPVIAVNPDSFDKSLTRFSTDTELLNVANQGDDDLTFTVSIAEQVQEFNSRVAATNQSILQNGFQQVNVGTGGSSLSKALVSANGTVNKVVTTQYSTDFEDFVLGDILNQQGWFARFTDNWIISDASPSEGSLHLRGLSDGNGPNQPAAPLALSPSVPVGSEIFSSFTARVQLEGEGVTWEIIPQSPTAGSVNTRLRFNADGTIDALEATAGNFVPVNATIPTGYFDLRIVVDRTTFDLTIYFDNVLVFSGVGFAGDIEQIALLSPMEVAGSTMDLDNIEILDGDPNAFWLSVSPISGTVGLESSTDLNVNFDGRVFESGVYNADILIGSNDPNTPQVTVPVTLTILDPPTIAVDPESLNAAVDVTAADPPIDVKTLTVTNSGESDLTFTASPGPSSLAIGSVIAGQNAIANLDMTRYGVGNDPNLKEKSISVQSKNLAKLALPLTENANFTDSIFYDSGVNAATNFSGLQTSPYTTGMRFDVEKPSFTLTAVRNAFRTEAVADPMTIVEVIRGGDDPNAGELLISTTIDSESADGALFLTELGQGFTFSQGEHFWIVHKYPEGIEFPQGVEDGGTQRPGTYFFSSDGGTTYSPSGFVFLTRALSGSLGDSFITLEPSNGVIPPDGSLDITVTFDATGVANGTYNTDINFASNDPATPLLAVPTVFEVSGQVTGIAVSEELLLFGDVFIGADKTLCFTILNDGLSELDISGIASDNPEFTVDVSAALLAAGDSVKVSVTYTPTETGNSNAVITINSNAPGEETVEVVVGGVGSEPPVIVVTPEEVNTALDAGQTTTENVTIKNDGNSPLTFSFPDLAVTSILADPNTVRNNTDIIEFANAPRAKGEIDNRVGNPIVLNAGTDNEFGYTWIASNEDGGPVFSWEDITTDGTDITADVGGDGDLEVDLPFTFDFYGESHNKIRIAGNGFLTFQEITASFGAFSNQQIPSVGNPDAVIAAFWHDIEPQNGTIHYLASEDKFVVQYTQAPEFFGAAGETVTFQTVLYPDGSIEYYYLDVATASFITSATVGIENADGSDGAQVAFNTAFLEDELAVRFVAPSRPITPFITNATPLSGVVAPGAEKIVEVEVDATSLNDGTYFDDLVISSNDPVNSPTTVQFTLVVTGFPEIAVNPDALTFDPLFIGLSSQQSVSIANIGSKDLEISDITNGNPDYTLDSLVVTPLTIAPGDSLQVMVTFTPSSIGEIADVITITSNDVFGNATTTVEISGIGLDPPVISVDPESIAAEVVEGGQTEATLTIANNGGSDLIYTAKSPSFVDLEAENQVPIGNYPEMNFERIVSKEAADNRVGPPIVNASGGPGTFGYKWVDNNSGGPDFDFVDISGTGTPAPVGADDGVIVALPFDFPFFGVDRQLMVIASNGFLTFQGELGFIGGFSNAPIPNASAPNDVIAGLWDDIEPQDGGGVFFQGSADAFIVQYNEVPKFLGDPADVVTFQIILFPDGTIKLQYETVEGTASSETSTVGVEGPDGTTGLQVLFNTPFLTDGLAITITPPITGVLAPGESTELTVILDATDLEEGVYEDNILVESNDPANPVVAVPVILNVIPACAIPENLMASEVDANSAQINWDEVSTALEYEFNFRQQGAAWTRIFTEEPSFALEELDAGTVYQVRVRSICSENGHLRSDWSKQLKFTTSGASDCTIPSDLTVDDVTETGATANWNGGALRYEVLYKFPNSGWQREFVGGPSIGLSDLLSGTEYKIKVRSICSENGSVISGFSELVSFTTLGEDPCTTPETPEVVALSDTEATLSWTAANGALSYELSYLKDGDPWTRIVVNGTEFTITDLDPGTNYRARVRSFCSENGQLRSSYSGRVKFTTSSSNGSIANGRLAGDEEQPAGFESAELNVYPNPSTGMVHMKMGLLQGERVSLKVFNLHGALIANREVEGQLNETFDFSGLAKGVYMTHVTSNTGRKVLRRLIIQ